MFEAETGLSPGFETEAVLEWPHPTNNLDAMAATSRCFQSIMKSGTHCRQIATVCHMLSLPGISVLHIAICYTRRAFFSLYHGHDRSNPICPESHRGVASGQRQNCAVLLAVRPSSRRAVRIANRRYRSVPIEPGQRQCDSRGNGLVTIGCGRRALFPIGANVPLSGGRRGVAC